MPQADIITDKYDAHLRANVERLSPAAELQRQTEIATGTIEQTLIEDPDPKPRGPISAIKGAEGEQFFPTLGQGLQATVGGITDAAINTTQAAIDFNMFMGGVVPSSVEGDLPTDLTTLPPNMLLEHLTDRVPEVEGVTSTPMIRGTARFLTGFIPLMKAIRIPSAFLKATAAGFTADLFVADPRDPRISQLIMELDPRLRTPALEWLASPSDTRLEDRLKTAIEGAALGLLGDGLFAALRVLGGASRLIAAKGSAAQVTKGGLREVAPEGLQPRGPRVEGAEEFFEGVPSPPTRPAAGPEEVSRPFPGPRTGAGPGRTPFPGGEAFEEATGRGGRVFELEDPKETARQIMRLHQEGDGGSTFNLFKGNQAGQDVVAVSPFPNRTAVSATDGKPGILPQEFTEDFVADYMAKNGDKLFSNSDYSVGTWFDKESNRIFVDVSMTLPEDQAAVIGRAANQKSGFHLGRFEEIEYGGTGDIPEGFTEEVADRLIQEFKTGRDAIARSLDNPEANGKILNRFIDPLTNEKGAVQLRGSIGPKLRTNSKVFNDLASVGAAVLWRGARNIKQFEQEMVKEFGDAVTPHIPRLHAASRKELAKIIRATNKDLPNMSTLGELFHRGEFGKEWYDRAFDELKEVFGEEDARMFALFYAATSPNNTTQANMTLALKAFELWKGGEKVFSGELGFIEAHQRLLNQAIETGSLTGPKVGPFSRALLGDENAIVIDRWMLRAFGFTKDVVEAGTKEVDEAVTEVTLAATNSRIKFMQKTIADEAERAGVSPRQYQAALWIAQKLRDEGEGAVIDAFDVLLAKKLPERKGLMFMLDDSVAARFTSTTAMAGILSEAMFNREEQDRTFDEVFEDKIVAAGAGPNKGLVKQLIGMVKKILKTDPVDKNLGAKGRIPIKVKEVSSEKLAQFLQAAPGEIKVGRKVLRVPWENMTDKGAFEELISRTTKIFQEELKQLKVGEVVSDLELQNLADEWLGNPQAIAEIVANPAAINRTSLEVKAFQQLMEASSLRVSDLSERLLVAKGDTAAEIERQLGIQLNAHVGLVAGFFRRSSEAGRTLRAVGTAQRSLSPQARAVTEIVQKPGFFAEGVSVRRMAELIRAGERFEVPAKGGRFAKFVRRVKKTPKALMELYVNYLLGPKTHAVNLLTNTLFPVELAVEREVAAIFSSLRGAERDRVAHGEGAQLLAGWLGSSWDAIRLAGRTAKTGKTTFGGAAKTDVAATRAISAANFELTGNMGRVADFMGFMINLNTRGLVTEDELFKAMGYWGQKRAIAYRLAKEQSTDIAERARIMESILNNFDDAAIEAEAREFAQVATFTNDLGRIGTSVKRATEDFPPFKIVVPFTTAPANLANTVFERAPGLNLLSSRLRADLAAGGVRGDMAKAKMAVGGVYAATIAMFVKSGVINGPEKANAGIRELERATGILPDSIRIGDETFQIDRTDPFGMFISMVARVVELQGELPEEDLVTMGAAIMVAFSDSFMSKTYMRNMQELLDVAAGVKRGEFTRMGKWVKRQAATVTNPAALLVGGTGNLRAITREIDPTMREAETFIQMICKDTPTCSSSLPPHRDFFADPRITEDAIGIDLFNPIPQSKVRTGVAAQVANQLLKDKVRVSMPPRVLFGRAPKDIELEQRNVGPGIRLNPFQYNELMLNFGKRVRVRGKTLAPALLELVNSTEYKRATPGPDGGKEFRVRVLVHAFKKKAINKLMRENDEIMTRMIEVKKERAEALR